MKSGPGDHQSDAGDLGGHRRLPEHDGAEIVAIAGSSKTSSAYVARAIRAMASWSQTYGITDELTPAPI